MWLAPAGEVAGLCPVEALVGALGGRVRARAEGHLNASLPEGELKLTAGEQRAIYQGKECVLAAAPIRGSDGLYLAAPALGRLLDRKVEEQGEEALFLAAPTRDGLQLLEARLYTEGPAWYLVGRVQNTGKLAQELAQVSWEVGDANGEVVASTSGYINHLNPGEAKAFKLMLPLREDGAWYR
ncbi:MAG TPA: hypothetical protein GX511_06360, partial [Firmicutes bacterium]|nr:hypothetical protein [Bacillota bacterium]